MLMLKTVTFEYHNWKVHNENELHYSVLKSSCYQLLDFGIKNIVLRKKIDIIST